MKFFFVSLLACTSAQKWDMDQSSLLQSKIAKGDNFAVLDEAVVEMSNVATNDDDTHVAAFAQKFKASAVALLKIPVTEQNALLRRAGQSHELTKIVRQYAALPDHVKQAVNSAVVSSEELISAFESLPVHEKDMVLMQVDNKAMEQVATGKTRTRRIEGGNIVTETFTKNGDGGHMHRHVTGPTGTRTETTTRDKTGRLVHQHIHEYTHNGRGGNARTETVTRGKSNYRHSHVTSHSLSRLGITQTVTATSSEGDNINNHLHRHDHVAQATDGSVYTRTISNTDGNRAHIHEHELDPN